MLNLDKSRGSQNWWPAKAARYLLILAALLIALGSVQSLVAIIAIYREGGILKRLRATLLSPVTILSAQVGVKLGFAVPMNLRSASTGLVVLPLTQFGSMVEQAKYWTPFVTPTNSGARKVPTA